VLEGSAQRDANRVRIAAELIHVKDQTQIWADTFEREMAGILSLQSELARELADALALELLPEEQARLAAAGEVNPDAYEAYLKGTYHWQKMTPADLDTAQRYLELARDLDPDYAPAYEGLSFVWMVREQMGQAPYEDAAPRARAAAYKAVELDERSAGAHFALAGVKTWRDWDWRGAWPEWRRALELNPNHAEAHAFYGHFLATIGRLDEGLAHSKRAVELDPFDAMLQGLYGVALCFHERYDDALAAARTALAIQPTEPMALIVLQQGSTVTGRYEDTMAATVTQLDTFYGGNEELKEALTTGWEAGGLNRAMRSLGEAMAELSETSFILPVETSSYFLFGGDLDRALDWLEKGYEAHDPGMPYIGMPFYFGLLHADPRYQELLRKMNLPLEPGQPLDLEEP
jgi:tetratricopeptide (TPR) repeat protein